MIKEHLFIAVIIILIIATCYLTYGGERLPASELLNRTDACALVFADLKNNKINLLLWIVSPPENTKLNLGFNVCLPNTNMLKSWIEKYKNLNKTSFYKKVIDKGYYLAIVFFKKYENELKLYCETETLLLRHLLESPDYNSFREELLEAIKEKNLNVKVPYPCPY